MAYVEDRGNGKFKARKRVDGKLVSKSFTSRTEAWAWAEETAQPPDLSVGSVTARGPAGSFSVPSSGAPILTFGEFHERGGHVVAHLRETTQAWQASIARKHILPYWRDVPLDAITHTELQNWLLRTVSPTVSPITTKHIGKVMHSMMASAVKGGFLSANPAKGLLSPRVDDEEMRFLTPDEVRALGEAMDPTFAAYVPLAASCGLRIGEALGLRWGRVDTFKSRIEIAEQITEADGAIVAGPPKTRAGRRTIAMPRRVSSVIADHKRRQGGQQAAGAFVFPAPGGGPMHPSNFRRRVWAPAVARAGLEPLRPHDLRHTAVALWIAAGASPKEIAVRAGHTSVSFCLDRYGHLYPAQDEKLAAALDGDF